jgi:hypothetical protein
MALRQGKEGIFTPASAGCAYSIEERIWRPLTIALVCSAVCAICIEYSRTTWRVEAAANGFFAP